MNASPDRYQRQILLKDFGEEGQQKLLHSSVIVIGAGGLGCPLLQYLAAAGIGKIGIVDDDVVTLTNLHRQVLYTGKDLGSKKVEVAVSRLKEMNPSITIEGYAVHLTNENAIELLSCYDIVVDGTDNFYSRYILNDACVLLGKPLVYGAISQFDGQVAVFNVQNPGGEYSYNYRDLFPAPPTPGTVLNCDQAGVIGVLPGLIGIMEATEVIKLVTGIGQPLVNRLFTYNSLTNESFVFEITACKEIKAMVPVDTIAFKNFDYQSFCGRSLAEVEEIDVMSVEKIIDDPTTDLIDVREAGEQPSLTDHPYINIPLSELKKNIPELTGESIVVFCQTGIRSKEAAKLLSTTFGTSKKIYSLTGGILAWKNYLNGKQET